MILKWAIGILIALAVTAHVFLIHEMESSYVEVSQRVAENRELATQNAAALSATWPDAQLAVRLENGLWCGTGFPVKCEEIPGGFRVLIVTARHVAEDDPSIPDWAREMYQHPWTATAIGGQLQGGRVVSLHPEVDVAVMEFFTTSGPVPVLQVTDYDPKYGEEVAHSGYPVCDEFLRTSSGLACDDGIATFSSAPGCSGGPVFNAQGEVIGVLVGGLGNGMDILTFTSRYVPAADFLDWLEGII